MLSRFSSKAIDFDRSHSAVLGVALVFGFALHLALLPASGPIRDAADVLWKLPPVLGDLACALLVYAIAARFAAPDRAVQAALFVALSPALIVLSAGRGRWDALGVALLLGSVLLIIESRHRKPAASIVAAWALLALAGSLAPAAYAVAPLLALGARARIAATLGGIALAGGLALLLAFVFHRDIFALHDAVSSAAAFNAWAIGQAFWFPEATRPFPGARVSEAAIGVVVFVCACALVLATYLRKRTDEALIVAACLLAFAFFLFPTRMHDRDLLAAIVLAQAALVLGLAYRRAAAILTFTFTVNVFYALYYAYLSARPASGVDRIDIAPFLSRPLAFVNLAVFAALAWHWHRSREAGAGLRR